MSWQAKPNVKRHIVLPVYFNIVNQRETTYLAHCVFQHVNLPYGLLRCSSVRMSEMIGEWVDNYSALSMKLGIT